MQLLWDLFSEFHDDVYGPALPLQQVEFDDDDKTRQPHEATAAMARQRKTPDAQRTFQLKIDASDVKMVVCTVCGHKILDKLSRGMGT